MGPPHVRRIVCLATLSGAALAAACGGSRSASTLPARPLPSYLALYPQGRASAVYFLQWERRGDSVHGALTVVYPTGRHTSRTAHAVEGVIDDQSVTLDVGEDSQQRWEGERKGRRIAFQVALESGSEQTLTFVPASLAAYKRAVARVRAGR